MNKAFKLSLVMMLAFVLVLAGCGQKAANNGAANGGNAAKTGNAGAGNGGDTASASNVKSVLSRTSAALTTNRLTNRHGKRCKL
ncbi:hypothetical protein HMSSN036_29430 [Paenibacillus macerans]|nr:hypothetical protein HMSSN036_29430 [Paenibacillus macerans]